MQIPLRLQTTSVLALGLSMSAPALPAGHDVAAPSVAEIIHRSIAANTADWKSQPEYGYREFDQKSKITSSGAVQPQQSRTYEVLMLEGSPYSRLVAIDNEPLTAAQAAEEKAKLEREMLRRQHESDGDRRARIAKYQNNRAEEHMLMQQMTEAFNFTLVGEETLEGGECYVLDASPKPDYNPPVQRAKVLTGMRGRLWIDKSGYHWVRVKAEVISPVEFGLCLAQVKPGTKFELDQAAVGGVWLPKSFTESVSASVLGLYGYRNREEEHYSDYHLNQLSAGARTAIQ
jgi:hypothetical protein